jgi:hypothetical protein
VLEVPGHADWGDGGNNSLFIADRLGRRQSGETVHHAVAELVCAPVGPSVLTMFQGRDVVSGLGQCPSCRQPYGTHANDEDLQLDCGGSHHV